MEAPTLGGAVRAARTREGLSIREVARRAGIASSQVSRIEKGEIASPEARTLKAIAAALGRPSLPLAVLATGPGAWGEELLYSTSVERELLERETGRWTHEEVDDLLDQIVTELDAVGREKISRYAHDLFVYITLGSHAESTSFAEDLNTTEFEPLMRAWVGLTDQRRKLVLGYAAEQAALSELDRLGSNPQRVRLTELKLEEAGS